MSDIPDKEILPFYSRKPPEQLLTPERSQTPRQVTNPPERLLTPDRSQTPRKVANLPIQLSISLNDGDIRHGNL